MRELENCIQYMVAVNSGPLLHVADLPSALQNHRIQEKSQHLAAAKRPDPSITGQIPKSLWAHALKTFGSASLATEWFSARCGALGNRAPIDTISYKNGRAEIDRILGCIDYGMIA